MVANRMPPSINDEIPKSRITLTYRTAVGGEQEEVNLPFRLLMMGDFSQGTSKDRKVDLDQRNIRNLDGTNTNEVMQDMGMSLSFTVANKIEGEGKDIDVTLPIDSMKSFSPAVVAENVPKIKSMLLLRKLLLEVQANLDNHKEFRQLIRKMAQTKGVSGLKEELAKLSDEFKNFEVPETTKPAAEGADGAED